PADGQDRAGRDRAGDQPVGQPAGDRGMRRRRRHLEVSTFPFLAVLLCTMGSLILLLLVLDRRAKIVALNKVREQAAQRQAEQEALRHKTAEEERIAAERRAEYERRRQTLHALLAQQEAELVGQVDQARGKLAEAAAKVQREQDRAQELKDQLQGAGLRLAASKQSLQARQQTADQSARLSEEARRELARQAAELGQLEQTLANLRALRERQKNTYSVVPYLGRRGDSRKPLYVECA